jgi:diguanylate cyclase (GGDEF)-like protein/PAS domain S-box-containing protein
VGYFIATVASFYSNMAQYERLSHLEETWFPMASLGSEMRHVFQTQIDRHEDAFLTGGEELDGEINSLQFRLMNKFDLLEELIRKNPYVPLPLSQIELLKKDYGQLLELGQGIEPWMGEDAELTPVMQKEIQRHGRLQHNLLERFTALDERFSACFIEAIQENKAKSLHTTFFLGFLFVLVILCVTVIIEKMAGHLLIKPLTTIKDNIRRFAVFHDVVEPEGVNPSDEVGLLASAFWEMTKDLKATTVSKRYVDNIIRNMSGALVVLGLDDCIQKVNQQATELFGYGEGDLIGQRVTLLFANGEDNPLHNVRGLENWFCRNVEVDCRRQDGHVFKAHFSGSTMDNEIGKVVGIVCVLNDITEMKIAEQKLKRMALYDALTGLANRHLFFDRLDLAIHEAKRSGNKFALLFLDLDNFKPVNDTFGHDIGDLVLKEVAARLQHLVRSGDTVARVGGDEFTIVLTGIHEEQAAARVAEKIIQCIGAPFIFGEVSCPLGVSIGVSLFPDQGEMADLLINKADQAMYSAKNKGRNTYCFYRK